jgi:hypothetical protein
MFSNSPIALVTLSMGLKLNHRNWQYEPHNTRAFCLSYSAKDQWMPF